MKMLFSTYLLINTITCWASGATVKINIDSAGPNAISAQPKNDINLMIDIILLDFFFLK